MKYLYFATFTKNEDNQYEIEFPDLAPHVATYGNSLSEAFKMAHESLEGCLLTSEDFNDEIPVASTEDELKYDSHTLLIPIEVDTTLAREKEANTMVKKTLTIPKYLNDLGIKNKINFSSTLTEALKEKLNV